VVAFERGCGSCVTRSDVGVVYGAVAGFVR